MVRQKGRGSRKKRSSVSVKTEKKKIMKRNFKNVKIGPEQFDQSKIKKKKKASSKDK